MSEDLEKDALIKECSELRAANNRLHRRCQRAEAAIPDYAKCVALPAENGHGFRFIKGTLGRAMLVAFCDQLHRENVELKTRLEKTHQACP